MSDPKSARVLLEAAERDLSALRGMTDKEVFADEIAGFLAQQATEKLVKAWIALLGETYPITHDIAQLLGVLCRPADTGDRSQRSRRTDALCCPVPLCGPCS